MEKTNEIPHWANYGIGNTVPIGEQKSLLQMLGELEKLNAMYRRITSIVAQKGPDAAMQARQWILKWEGKIIIDEIKFFESSYSTPGFAKLKGVDNNIYVKQFTVIIMYRVPENLKDEYELK